MRFWTKSTWQEKFFPIGNFFTVAMSAVGTYGELANKDITFGLDPRIFAPTTWFGVMEVHAGLEEITGEHGRPVAGVINTAKGLAAFALMLYPDLGGVINPFMTPVSGFTAAAFARRQEEEVQGEQITKESVMEALRKDLKSLGNFPKDVVDAILHPQDKLFKPLKERPLNTLANASPAFMHTYAYIALLSGVFALAGIAQDLLLSQQQASNSDNNNDDDDTADNIEEIEQKRADDSLDTKESPAPKNNRLTQISYDIAKGGSMLQALYFLTKALWLLSQNRILPAAISLFTASSYIFLIVFLEDAIKSFIPRFAANWLSGLSSYFDRIRRLFE